MNFCSRAFYLLDDERRRSKSWVFVDRDEVGKSTRCCGIERCLNISSIRLIEPGRKRTIPPFCNDCVLEKFKDMGYIGWNCKVLVGAVDSFSGDSILMHDPDSHFSGKDEIMLRIGMQIPRTHNSSLGMKKIEALAPDLQVVDLTALVPVDRRDGNRLVHIGRSVCYI
jgi:hypothetical protein